MEHKSRRLVAEPLQSIESELQGDKNTSSDTESVQHKKWRAQESCMSTVEDEDEEHIPPGR